MSHDNRNIVWAGIFMFLFVVFSIWCGLTSTLPLIDRAMFFAKPGFLLFVAIFGAFWALMVWRMIAYNNYEKRHPEEPVRNTNLILSGIVLFVVFDGVFALIAWWGLTSKLPPMDRANILAEPEFLQYVAIISVVFALMVGTVVAFNMNKRRRNTGTSDRLKQQTSERGWQYRYGEDGVHDFSGTTRNIPWHIEVACRRTGHAAFDDYTLWRTDAIKLSGEVVLLVSKSGKMDRIFGLGSKSLDNNQSLDIAANELLLSYHVTSVMFIDDPEDDREYDSVQKEFNNVRQAQVGSGALREHYFVVATSETAANRFLDEDAERMLLELVSDKRDDTQKPQLMAVVFWRKGIQFMAEGQIVDIDQLEQLVQLGLALASGQKSSAGS